MRCLHKPWTPKTCNSQAHLLYVYFPGIDCLSLELRLHVISFSCFFFSWFCWFCSKHLLLVFFLDCVLFFFSFFPPTKFAKLGVSTTRPVSAKEHKRVKGSPSWFAVHTDKSDSRTPCLEENWNFVIVQHFLQCWCTSSHMTRSPRQC